MSSTDGDQRSRELRKMLTSAAAGGTDAVAGATIGIWLLMSARLTTVIGERGVSVLRKRAVHKTLAAFPWLAIDDGESRELLACVRQRLAARDAALAVDAGHALLMMFTELLESLIGESLVERLLGPVWTPRALTADKENAG